MKTLNVAGSVWRRLALAAIPGLFAAATAVPALAGEQPRRKNEVRSERGEPGRDVDMERRELMGRLEALERKMVEVRGREGPEAEGARREVGEAMREVRGRIEALNRRAEGPPPAARPDIERRVRHLRAAADNLREAGMEDAAQRIMGEAEELSRQAGQPGRGAAEPRPPAVQEEMHRRLEEMAEVIRKLQRELEMLRQKMREVSERQRP